MIEVIVIARFDTLEAARAALSDMEEAVGKHNGDLEQTNVHNEEEE